MCGMSTTAMGSSASTVKTVPGASRAIAFFAKSAGRGHLRPRRSRGSSMASSWLEHMCGSRFPANREACSLGLLAALRREYIYLTSIGRTLWLLRLVKPGATRSIVDIVEEQVRRRPGNAAIFYLDQRMSYAELDARANRYAHWAM